MQEVNLEWNGDRGRAGYTEHCDAMTIGISSLQGEVVLTMRIVNFRATKDVDTLALMSLITRYHPFVLLFH
jgi:hypothetical protein